MTADAAATANQTKVIKDLNTTLVRLVKAIEHSNRLEIEKARDIQVRNQLAFGIGADDVLSGTEKTLSTTQKTDENPPLPA